MFDFNQAIVKQRIHDMIKEAEEYRLARQLTSSKKKTFHSSLKMLLLSLWHRQ
nr:hypothetical protein [Evansella caseinilytica]